MAAGVLLVFLEMVLQREAEAPHALEALTHKLPLTKFAPTERVIELVPCPEITDVLAGGTHV